MWSAHNLYSLTILRVNTPYTNFLILAVSYISFLSLSSIFLCGEIYLPYELFLALILPIFALNERMFIALYECL